MVDRPDAATLLRAMAETLTDEVMPATGGGARHAVRIVANLCRILEREIASGGEGVERSRHDLAALLGREGTLDELSRALDRELRERPENRTLEAGALRVLLDDVRRRLAIDKPGYDT